jgi:serine/threonine protein kinase
VVRADPTLLLDTLRVGPLVAQTPNAVICRCELAGEPFILKRTRRELCDVDALARMVGRVYEGRHHGRSFAHRNPVTRTITTAIDLPDGFLKSHANQPGVVARISAPLAVLSDDANVYEIYPFVRGTRLDSVVSNNAGFMRGDLLGLIYSTMMKAASQLHDDRVLHRDINPSNVLMDVADGLTTLTVIDGSFACTAAGEQIGIENLDYAPEEIVRGKAVKQSDWYTIAATCYFMANRVAHRHLPALQFYRGLLNMDTGILRPHAWYGYQPSALGAKRLTEEDHRQLQAYIADANNDAIASALLFEALLDPEASNRPSDTSRTEIGSGSTIVRSISITSGLRVGESGYIFLAGRPVDGGGGYERGFYPVSGGSLEVMVQEASQIGLFANDEVKRQAMELVEIEQKRTRSE